MRAFILVAGRGSRLGPYGEDRPKCLVELGGIPLIERQLATLRALGVEDIVLVTGYRADMLALPGTQQIRNPRWADTNMVESLFAAASLFTDDFLVCYGDIVYEPRVLDNLMSSKPGVSVVVDQNWRTYWERRFEDPLADAESLRMDDAGHIIDIGNRVADIDEIEAQYIGLMRFRGAGVDALRSSRDSLRRRWDTSSANRAPDVAYMTDLLMEMIRTGCPVHAVPVGGGWLEIDTSEDYEDAAAMFADGTIARFYDPNAVPVAGAK